MTKVQVEIEIPDYKIKCCDNTFNGRMCRYLESYDYGLKYYCSISGKDINTIKRNKRGGIDSIVRPYGCRVLARKYENKESEEPSCQKY